MEATSSAVSLPAEVAGLDASRYERSQAYGVRDKALLTSMQELQSIALVGGFKQLDYFLYMG